MTYVKRTLNEHFDANGSKRILALDGGGLRGILTLGILEQIEAELRTRHGNDPAVAAAHAFRALLSLMDDIATLQEVILQWMSASPTARRIDSELGTLEGDVAGGKPLLSYVRYDGDLKLASVQELLGDEARAMPVENLSALDAPENMDALYKLGVATGKRVVKSQHFPGGFDIT